MKQKLLLIVLALGMCSICLAQKRELKTEKNGYQWYCVSDGYLHYAVESKNGTTLIPITREYNSVFFFEQDDFIGYFHVMKIGEGEGICDLTGKEIISPSKGYSTVVLIKVDGHIGYYYIEKEGMQGACDITGKEIVAPQYKDLTYSTKGFETKNSQGYYALGIMLDSQGKAYNINRNNSYNSNNNGSSTTSVKELFDLAYNTPSSETQLKYDRYQKVIQADPNNAYGYKSLAYNNLGVLYENLEDYQNAKVYYEAALSIDPNNKNAKDNLKDVKRKIRNAKLDRISDALSAFGEALGGGQAGSSYNSYQGTGGTYVDSYDSYSSGSSGSHSSGSSSTISKNCRFCAGSGRCTGLHRCHGTGICNYCNGKKLKTTNGHEHECGACHLTGKCSFCGGTGRCKHCGGTGKG